MKSKIEKLIRKTSFVQGMIFSIALTSFFGYAATNLPGFFVFNEGEPISSGEMNDNFEKIAGVIKLKATNSATVGFTYGDGGLTSMVCNAVDEGFLGKVNFGNTIIGDANWQTAIDGKSGNRTNGDSYSFYTIPESGWYELRFVAAKATRGYTCTSGCNINLTTTLKLRYAQILASGQPDDSSFHNLVEVKDGWTANDNSPMDGTLAIGEINVSGIVSEIKRVYLESGYGIYTHFEMCLDGTTSTPDGAIFSAGDISLQIIQL